MRRDEVSRIAYASVAPGAFGPIYAYCVDMHAKDARAHGEIEQRLYAVVVWREAPFFADWERAARARTEAVSGGSHHGSGRHQRLGTGWRSLSGRWQALASRRLATNN